VFNFESLFFQSIITKLGGRAYNKNLTTKSLEFIHPPEIKADLYKGEH
jgi:hypothetical protein